MSLFFEWDPIKADKNLDKHKVAFVDATTVFADNFSITFPDPDHSMDEERFVTMGISQNGRLLVIAHTERDDRIRIISAREMTRNERHYYEENR